MPYRYDKLKGRIVEKYGTRKEFCNHIELTETSVSLKLSGKLGFTQKDIIAWSEALDILPEDIGNYFFT